MGASLAERVESRDSNDIRAITPAPREPSLALLPPPILDETVQFDDRGALPPSLNASAKEWVSFFLEKPLEHLNAVTVLKAICDRCEESPLLKLEEDSDGIWRIIKPIALETIRVQAEDNLSSTDAMRLEVLFDACTNAQFTIVVCDKYDDLGSDIDNWVAIYQMQGREIEGAINNRTATMTPKDFNKKIESAQCSRIGILNRIALELECYDESFSLSEKALVRMIGSSPELLYGVSRVLGETKIGAHARSAYNKQLESFNSSVERSLQDTTLVSA